MSNQIIKNISLGHLRLSPILGIHNIRCHPQLILKIFEKGDQLQRENFPQAIIEFRLTSAPARKEIQEIAIEGQEILMIKVVHILDHHQQSDRNRH